MVEYPLDVSTHAHNRSAQHMRKPPGAWSVVRVTGVGCWVLHLETIQRRVDGDDLALGATIHSLHHLDARADFKT